MKVFIVVVLIAIGVSVVTGEKKIIIIDNNPLEPPQNGKPPLVLINLTTLSIQSSRSKYWPVIHR